jgi:tetratricopeptide (TPR) repeat protein
LTWAREHPADFLKGLAIKSLQYCNAHRIDRNLDSRGFEAHSRLLRLTPGMDWLAPWLLLGCVVAVRRGGAAGLAAAYALTMFLATILVFVAERYKLDALPGLLPLALLGAQESVAQVRRRATQLPRGIAVLLLVAGLALSFGNWVGIRDLQPAHAATLEGVAHYKERDWHAALRRLLVAVEEQPTDADAQLTLGTTWQHLGRLPEAHAAYRRTHALVPGHPRPLLNSGWIERQQGDLDAARRSFSAALQLDARSAHAHLELATVLEMQGNKQEALQHYEATARLATDPQMAAVARQRLQVLRGRR